MADGKPLRIQLDDEYRDMVEAYAFLNRMNNTEVVRQVLDEKISIDQLNDALAKVQKIKE